jgi:FtsH-binding integral membrane protein
MYSDEYRYSTETYVDQSRFVSFIHAVYGWMSLALVVTAAVAFYVAHSPIMAYMAKTPFCFALAMIIPFGLLMIISFGFNKISYSTAIVLFLLYAMGIGFSLSTIFIAFTFPSIALTFVVTAGMFGVTALYGYFTKADLSKIGSMATMALFGLILAMLANMYFQSEATDYVISGIGVVLFTLLTAYDMQKIKQLGMQVLQHDELLSKAAILGAITLYLDFLNLFLFLLRFLGNRKE